MANISTTTNAAILKTTYDAEFGLDPYEEAVVADFVAKPVNMTAIGNTLTLRKVAATPASKYTGTNGRADQLTQVANTEAAVTTTLHYAYVLCTPDEPALTRLVDDANYRTALRKQMAAGVNSQIDADLFALAASLSHTEAGVAVNETIYASALKQLAKYAKNKFRIGQTDARLFVHPDVLDDVLVMPIAKEYQIRGTQGTAVSGQLVTTFGVKIEESGNVYQAAGSTYCPLIIKDAWAIGYNRAPAALPDQPDGIATEMIFRAEYGVCEWFDSSGVALVIT